MYGRAWLWRFSTLAVLLWVQHCQCGVFPLHALPLHHVRQLPLPGLALKLLFTPLFSAQVVLIAGCRRALAPVWPPWAGRWAAG